jgi:RNA polymerase sigma-70 factor, ECF subfamily
MVEPVAPRETRLADASSANVPVGCPLSAETLSAGGSDGGVCLDCARLVRDHHAALYRYAYRLTSKVQDAEDLVQQTFLVAQQKLGQVRSPDTARAWLFTVLRNVYLKACCRSQGSPLVGLEIDLSVLVQETPTEPIDREALQQALGELPAEFRVVVLMFYFEDQSYKQIAEALNAPIGTVMSRLSRAKAHLRRRLSPDETADAGKSNSVRGPHIHPIDPEQVPLTAAASEHSLKTAT